nr:LOW QUALITY PROTEIN: zinc transporter ZIP3-like [Rhipicephalus microplus]
MAFQWSQVVAPLLLLVGTLVSGLLPIWLVKRLSTARWGSKAFAFLVCIGGGVLFATSFLHLLPEVREGFEKLTTEFPVTEGVVCVGFLAVYALEEIVHACLGHSHHASDHGHSHTAVVMNCSTGRDRPRLSGPQSPRLRPWSLTHGRCYELQSRRGASSPGASEWCGNKHEFSADAVAEQDHGTQRVSLGSVLIVVALSFHSIFEGLSLGLQSTDQATWIMFLAISIHKFVIAFVVGFDMKASRMRTRTILIYMVIFSVMSPLGALIGAVTKNKLEDSPVVAGLNGVATGTLLYVTFFEVLQRDKNSQLSGVLQLLAVLLGFGVMLTLVLVLPHD